LNSGVDRPIQACIVGQDLPGAGTAFASLSASRFQQLDGLDTQRLGLGVSYQHKSGLGAYAPSINLGANWTRHNSVGKTRDRDTLERELSYSKRLSSVWHVMAALLLQPICVQAGELNLQAVDADTGLALADVVIELELPEDLSTQYSTPIEREVDQQDKEFVASTTLITRNSLVRFPNSDNILHPVYSFSEANVFELLLYGSSGNIDYFEKFETTGIVELGCNIHDWMLGYIYVADSDFAAATGEEGRATLQSSRAGSYRVKLWHARARPGDTALTKEVSISDGWKTQLRIMAVIQKSYQENEENLLEFQRRLLHCSSN